ncbi:hypothetical protein CBR_g24343 [Chara braunii]|uniref:Reverse transcriptase RNase H-like domain-containing protein n=1 Tax=Chara braunii TaxID=69332 RepID=A0A388JML8_CHABU|nr:hypothetical protein CBR_g24343 [Chara braunii]|eukprot:GBG58995.1 hypothetical protein CBR_g24343 [Chara braunii]
MKEEFREGGLVLGAPDYDATETRPFIVETDAGPTALGGVLIQADMEGKERPLRFESRTLCTTERNYSQFKRETLVVLHCLRIFRNYIFGRRFILRVDPTALAYSLRNYVPSDPTVARWLTYIWMFNFELKRIPGSKNRADGLSWINWDKQEGEAVENTPPVDGFLDQEEDVRLHINKWSPRVPNCVGYPIWKAPKGYERRNELVLKPFEEEDPWGVHTREEPPVSEGPLRELETHLDISQWRASPQGEEHEEQVEGVPREEVPQEEVSREEVPREEVPREEVPREEAQGTQRESRLGDRGRRAGKEVIEVGEDTPPQTPAVGLRLGDAPGSTRKAEGRLRREEAPLPSSERAPSPEGRAGRRREREAVRREALTLIDRHLAAYALEHPDLEEPTPAEPRQEPYQPEKEMEAEIPKRVDLHTRERAPAGETAKEKRARRTRRIDEIWQERQRLEAAGELPEQQQERQRSEAAGALPGPRQEPPMGRVILEPEEARAQRQAEKEAFEFRAPTELATLPVAAADPVVPLAIEEGLPPSSSEPAQGSAEGSIGVLLEAVNTMQEEASLFSPEQRIEEPLEREMEIKAEGAIDSRLQRMGTPEYGPE